jgi:anti-sigma factor RsiW
METPSMGCEDVRDLLALFAGGECREDEAEAVESHVALCGLCARELDQYRESRAALASLAEVPTPPGLGRAIWAGVRGELFPRAARPRTPWLDEVLRYAALLMLGIGTGVLLYNLRATPAAYREPEAPLGRIRAEAEVLNVAPVLRPPPVLRENADGHFYLPRAEFFPADGARDF